MEMGVFHWVVKKGREERSPSVHVLTWHLAIAVTDPSVLPVPCHAGMGEHTICQMSSASQRERFLKEILDQVV